MKHLHEPEIPPALDAEDHCLVCVLLVDRDGWKQEHGHLLRMFNQANEQRGELIRLLRATRLDLGALVTMLTNEIAGNLDEELRVLNCNALVRCVMDIDDSLKHVRVSSGRKEG